MARIKFSNLKETRGIVDKLSGQGKVMVADKNGVLRGLNKSSNVKRPNQYKKRL